MNTTTVMEFVRFCGELEKQGYDLAGGNCLDVAVGFALALISKGKHCEVVLLLREDDNDPNDTILSHAMVRHDGSTVDSEGFQADTKWIRDFNDTQRMNGDYEVEFWEETYSEKLRTLYSDCLYRFNMNNPSRVVLECTYEHMRKEFI